MRATSAASGRSLGICRRCFFRAGSPKSNMLVSASPSSVSISSPRRRRAIAIAASGASLDRVPAVRARRPRERRLEEGLALAKTAAGRIEEQAGARDPRLPGLEAVEGDLQVLVLLEDRRAGAVPVGVVQHDDG